MNSILICFIYFSLFIIYNNNNNNNNNKGRK